ncbi:hypothetical protein DFH07DRAFT_988063 [Mycena maculata]|uniref:Clp1-like protein n=1 Tax=Mycena maculata TaxID=230809 RepID=A0AAD7I5Z9_9AGAR|nr:hypothetical protein DFH07DRAFT_988063 [Mycena maculata]
MSRAAHRATIDRPQPFPHPSKIPAILGRLKEGNTDDVARSILAVLAPDLAHLPGTAIRQELFQRSPQLLAGLTALQFPHTMPANALPHEMAVLLPREQPRTPFVYPTHMLAISGPIDEYMPKDTHICMVPIHGAVFAAHSARINLPPIVPHLRQGWLTLPLYRMTVPSMTAFVSLRSYMYNRRIDVLLDALVPLPRAFLDELSQPVRAGARIHTACASPPEMTYLIQQMIYSTNGTSQLFEARLIKVKEMWETVCALVMCDELLWQGLDLAWHVVRSAFVVMVEKESIAARTESSGPKGSAS